MNQLGIPPQCRRENAAPEVLAKLPSFLVIGVAKGGTTGLFDNLAEHPQIVKPIPTKIADSKELRFFWKQSFYKRGPNFYADFFPDVRPGHLTFEATTAYIWLPVQARIAAMLPDVKAILMLREPAVRAWSHYWTFFSKPPYNDPITCLDDPKHQAVARGVYVDQIKRWHEHFPKKNLLILKSEDYFRDPHRWLGVIHWFLGVEDVPLAEISRRDPWADQKARWGYPELPEPIRRRLREYYRPHNERLSAYLGEDWTWANT